MWMKRWLTCALPVLCLCSSCAVVNEYATGEPSRDWVVFRGSPSLCGYTGCALPDAPRLLWSRAVHTRTVAAPIVYGGWVYTLDRKGRLRRFSPDGDSLTVHDFKTAVEASFVVDDSTLYVGRIDGHVCAYSITGKKVIWDFETMGQISGSPNLVGDHVLVGSYDGSMYTLQQATGRKTGQVVTGYYINGTAAVWKRYMMFGGCDAWVRVVDLVTGETTDSLELDTYVPASPAILDGVACACDYNGSVYEMTLDNGRIVKHRRLASATGDCQTEVSPTDGGSGAESGVVSMPTMTREAVYILSGERHITCIDRASGKVRWRKMLRGVTGECSPIVAQDRVLVCTKDGHVSILDCDNGKELWHYETGEPIVASPAVIGDRFYILTSRGTLLGFSD